MATLRNVYCFQVGSEDCYKIGLTKNPPGKRLRGFQTGSPAKFTLVRMETTDHPHAMEKHIHGLLSAKRAENGEFFYGTRMEIDAAFDHALRFVAVLYPLLADAETYKAQKPSPTLLPATDDLRDTYIQLKAALRERLLLEQKILLLESTLQVVIGGNAGIDGIASWNWIDNWQFDVATFKAKEPNAYEALYAQYKHNAGGRRFCLARGNLKKAAAAEE
jgi:Meiotically up-regulated gene 113